MYRFLDAPPRFLFFTGKGGVGKTSIACATAVHLADSGARVLLVSTDPASNIGQVLGRRIGNAITAIDTVPGLSAIEIDPEQAAEAYRERILGPVRGLLPEAAIASITEQLSGSCTTEVASFDEFTGLLTDETLIGGYDHVVFDTAPTGHTIRLLQLPGSWTEFLDEGKGDASCLGPMAGLDRQRSAYAAAVEALQDPERTRLILVTRPQESAVDEVVRTREELDRIGIRAANLVVNAVLPGGIGDDELVRAVRGREQEALAHLAERLGDIDTDQIPLTAGNVMGVAALRQLLESDALDLATPAEFGAAPEVPSVPEGCLSHLVDEIAAGGHGLVLCMGKGGVGKTTIAAAIAVGLVERGHAVHLTTTDPAAHLGLTLTDAVDNLRVTRIDPEQAVRDYREHVMATKGASLDEAGRARLVEDLRSPCTEEVAVFRAFSSAIREARRTFVVVDTAPTGHTLLLLDATGSYHRDIVRQMGGTDHITTPMMMLQDPELTKVVLVTLPEPTPVLEAGLLQRDLRRAGIEPWAWVVNNSVAAAHPSSPFLRRRSATEADPLEAVAAESTRVAVVALQVDAPVGTARLARLAAGATPRA